MDFKRYWQKFWYLLWKDQSLKGWIFAIIILFVVVKLIFFPALNFVSGSSHTLSIVESCSMYHKPTALFFFNFNKWWEEHEDKYSDFNITKEQFKKFQLMNGFNKGDILFTIKAKPEKLKVGDTILFDANQNNPIIHRIIKIRKSGDEYIFTTMGDNNPQILTSGNNLYGISEKNIKEDQLIGRALIRIVPYGGWAKLIFYDWKKPASERGLCSEN